MLAVADEWFPRRGGLSAFNRYLCQAMSRVGAEVFCLLPTASEAERADARSVGVTLVQARELPGGSEREALMRRPDLPGRVVPDVVIGHGRVTRPIAKCIAEDHFDGIPRLHFVHTEPDEVEWHKLDRLDDSGVRAEERMRVGLDLHRAQPAPSPSGRSWPGGSSGTCRRGSLPRHRSCRSVPASTASVTIGGRHAAIPRSW